MMEPFWPTYATGPRESIFALGMIGVNYVKLEGTLGRFVGIIFGADHEFGHFALAKLRNNEVTLSLLRKALSKLPWPEQPTTDTNAFLSSFKMCADNRNLLMHSDILAQGTDENILYKVNKEGKFVIARPSLQELRQVADDMYRLSQYGQHLANAISARSNDWTAAPVLPIPWPNISPQPQPLQYKPPY